jgi:hypothetical protein
VSQHPRSAMLLRVTSTSAILYAATLPVSSRVLLRGLSRPIRDSRAKNPSPWLDAIARIRAQSRLVCVYQQSDDYGQRPLDASSARRYKAAGSARYAFAGLDDARA